MSGYYACIRVEVANKMEKTRRSNPAPPAASAAHEPPDPWGLSVDGAAVATSRGRAPAYHQIAQVLRERIASGNFPVGTQLPTEDEIMKAFRVSRHTVRAAVHTLVVDGLVERFAGRG